MKPGTKFVCELNATPKITEAGEALTAYMEEYKQQVMFIKKQVENLDEKKQKLWRGLFDACVEDGKIAKVIDYDDIGMHLSDDFEQLFMSKRDGDGFSTFIKRLME